MSSCVETPRPLQCRISCNILVLIHVVVFAMESRLHQRCWQNLTCTPTLTGSLLLGIAKRRGKKLILAYLSRFLLLRFQKFSVGTMSCFHLHLLNKLFKWDSFFNRRYDGTARTRPTISAGMVCICIYVCPFALGLGILGILAASLQKYWLLAKVIAFWSFYSLHP